jgi:hypothetical protein
MGVFFSCFLWTLFKKEEKDMNEAAYNTLVDAVHHLMKLEK